uniref:DUF4219 domain-containing protein n=1 Tax=Arundo donax TaxID=35708 RepID=A0A0A9CYR5_ARUDO
MSMTKMMPCDDTSSSKAIVSSGLGNSTMATAGRLSLPMLTRTNYVVWVMRMKYLLRTNSAWGAMHHEKEFEDIDESKEQLALTIIS